MKRLSLFAWSLLLLFACTNSPRYAVGECAYCKFEDNPPSALEGPFYRVTAVDEAAKTYALTVVVSEASDESSRRSAEIINKTPQKMTFAELDRPRPQGRTPKCTMTKVACP